MKNENEKYKLSKGEREITIAFTEEDTEAIVYANIKAWIKRLDKLCSEFPNRFKVTQSDEYSKTYGVPKEYVRIVKPRNVSQQDRDKRAQRIRNISKTKESRGWRDSSWDSKAIGNTHKLP